MPVTIIAEAGVNHNGSLEMAKEMARVAKACADMPRNRNFCWMTAFMRNIWWTR